MFFLFFFECHTAISFDCNQIALSAVSRLFFALAFPGFQFSFPKALLYSSLRLTVECMHWQYASCVSNAIVPLAFNALYLPFSDVLLTPVHQLLQQHDI